MVIVNYALNLLKAEQNYNVDDNHIALVILSAKLAAGEIFEIIDRVNNQVRFCEKFRFAGARN